MLCLEARLCETARTASSPLPSLSSAAGIHFSRAPKSSRGSLARTRHHRLPLHLLTERANVMGSEHLSPGHGDSQDWTLDTGTRVDRAERTLNISRVPHKSSTMPCIGRVSGANAECESTGVLRPEISRGSRGHESARGLFRARLALSRCQIHGIDHIT